MIVMGADARGTLIAFPGLAADRPIVSQVARTRGYSKKEFTALVREALTGETAAAGARLGELARSISKKQALLLGEAICQNMRNCTGDIEALRQILRDTGWVNRTLRQTRSRAWRKRAEGAKGFGLFGGEQGVEVLTGLLDDKRREVRLVAAYALVEIGGARGLQALVRAVADGRLGECGELPFILCGVALRRMDLVLPLLTHPEKTVQLAALSALGNSGRPQAAKYILRYAESADPALRAMAAKNLGRLRCLEARGQLCRMLKDENWEVRASAARALREFRGTRSALKVIRQHS